ncbi:MAG: hypothetical protein MJZ56_04965 [Bacteroidales bacterium]|nr:hypothetical protein [Bacteroidales bacterium]
MASSLAESAVFGDEFQELAEVVVFGTEAVEGGAVDFGVGLGGEQKWAYRTG